VAAALLSPPGVAIALLAANQLVYAFTYSSAEDVYARDSQNPAEARSTNTSLSDATMA
jgi:hypothetical protein